MTISGRSNQALGFEMPVSVSPEIFSKHPDSAYWIGRIASGGEQSEYYDGLARFRAKVYVQEMGFLSNADIDEQGRELDEDDDRSIHFAVLENLSSKIPPHARVVGSGRLIQKTNEEEVLPIEVQFPEVFSKNPIAPGSVEVSRFISRHEDQLTQHSIALSVIRAMSHYSVGNSIEKDYCIIEKPLLGLLSKIGIPLELISEPKKVEEPGGIRELYPIVIDPKLVLDSVLKDAHDRMFLKHFFENEIANKGEGYYPATLIGGSHE